MIRNAKQKDEVVMRDWKKNVYAFGCLLPVAVLFACVFLSLRGYVKPTFQAEEISAEEAEELKQAGSATEKPTETTKPESKPKINIKKTVALPPVSETQKTSKSKLKSKSIKTSVPKKTSTAEGYRDGIYCGTGTGFQGEIKVKVTIKKGKINTIEVVKSQDGASYLERASALLTRIIKKQSTNVDAVSGATYSSNGLIEATEAALKKAEKKHKKSDKKSNKNTEKNKDKDKDTSDKDKTEDKKTDEDGSAPEVFLPSETIVPMDVVSPTPVPSSGEENTETLVYANGTYQASAICNPNVYADFDAYTLSLKITIANDLVTSVTDVKGSGTLYDSSNDWYIKRAVDGTSKYPGVTSQIISKGTCEGVDVVSGATCSSKAIIEAVKKALESAKK
jgi:uncharacterized protein with FMN-binding domain